MSTIEEYLCSRTVPEATLVSLVSSRLVVHRINHPRIQHEGPNVSNSLRVVGWSVLAADLLVLLKMMSADGTEKRLAAGACGRMAREQRQKRDPAEQAQQQANGARSFSSSLLDPGSPSFL